MSYVDLHGSMQIVIPCDERVDAQISCPGSVILQALPGLNGQPHDVLRRRLAEHGIELAPGTEQNAANEISDFAAGPGEPGFAPVKLIPTFLRAKREYRDLLLPFQAEHEPAVFALGARNGGQNFFCSIAIGAEHPIYISRPGENLSLREHLVLYSRRGDPGHLAIGWAYFGSERIQIKDETAEVAFAIAGAPLVAGGRAVPTQTRIGYRVDLRHEFHISPSRWRPVLAELEPLLFASPDPTEAGAAVLRKADELGLSIETGYWLESIGVGPDGQLNLVSGRMSATEAAERQLAMGSVGALLNQEGGSCAYTLWECEKDFKRHDRILRDVDGRSVWEPAPRFFGMNTYFRPRALTLCVIKLKNFVAEPPFR